MELELLKNFTIRRLHIKLNLPEEEFQQWLTDLKMLHKKRTCDCGSEMRKEKRQNYGRWVCRKKFESYMDEFVWKQQFGGDDCFYYLISQIVNNKKYLCE
ncbi:hypothetical protein ACQ4LE_009709 [Meloidogyne hapla]